MDSAVPIMRREEVQLETKKLKSSRSQVVFKIGILKNFAIFTGEHLCWTLFLMRPETFSLKACNFIKKRLQHRYFLVNIVNFFKNSFFYRTPPVAASKKLFINLQTLNKCSKEKHLTNKILVSNNTAGKNRFSVERKSVTFL